MSTRTSSAAKKKKAPKEKPQDATVTAGDPGNNSASGAGSKERTVDPLSYPFHPLNMSGAT